MEVPKMSLCLLGNGKNLINAYNLHVKIQRRHVIKNFDYLKLHTVKYLKKINVRGEIRFKLLDETCCTVDNDWV